MSKLVRFLMPIIIAVALGPLIAGIAATVLALIINLVDRTSAPPIADAVSMSTVYIVAYLTGAALALLAELLVLWRAPCFAVVVAAAVIATTAYMGACALSLFGAPDTNAQSSFVFTLIFAVTAAADCRLLTTRYVRAA